MKEDFSTRLLKAYSGAVYDVLRELGLPHQTLPSSLRPLHSKQRTAGPAFTVTGRLQEAADPHETLLKWTRFLSEVPKGNVVVCQPNDSTVSHMGELSAETLHIQGVRGYIVDGGCRDSEFIANLGLPVFCRYHTPADIVGRWLVDQTQVPVTIGTVTVTPGDYAFADRDGVVIVPGNLIAEVAGRVEALVETENLVRKAIREGIEPEEAYLQYGKF